MAAGYSRQQDAPIVKGLMQDVPLTLAMAFRRCEQLSAAKTIVTATAIGRERTTYGVWAERTRRLAAGLDALEVTPGGRVGTYGWNTVRHLELYFAVPCTKRVLHTLNIRSPAEQTVYAVNHAGDEVIFVDRSLVEQLWPMVDLMPGVRHVIVMDDGAAITVPADPRVVDYEELLGRVSACGDLGVHDENAAAAICYTSGTTGNPKGVVYTHRSMMLHALTAMFADTFALSERDVVLPVVPMFHANAWGQPHAAVMAGASLVLPGPDLSAPAIATLISDEQVSLASGVPTIWAGVLGELAGRDASALTRIVCGGSAVPRSLSEAYRRELGRPILQAWGMTETSPVGSVARIISELEARPEHELADLRATAGIPAPLVEARIVEADGGTALPWDGTQQGELQVRGPYVASSYYDDERSGESFTPDGWLRTGDIATIDPNGYIRLVDRTKDAIKSGGEWISSVQLENEIMADERVAEAAVIGVPDVRWGERPLASVVPVAGVELTAADVRAHLEGRVAKWWIPERIEFIDEVPKTSVGKFSKQALRERFTGAKVTPGGPDGVQEA